MKNRKEKKAKSFKFIALLVLLIVCVFGVTSVFFAMNGKIKIGNKNNQQNNNEVVNTQPEENTDEIVENIEDETQKGDTKINVLVMGTDKVGLHSDVDFVVSFDTETKKMSLLSIPRDTKVVMTDEMIQSLLDRDREQFIPNAKGVRGQCKLTEVYAYAGDGYRDQFVKMAIEDLLGIEIDHYVTVDLQGFKNIVDAFGGVDMVVQERLYYSDPAQDLYIDLYPGYQHLDGDKAEQLVRYRDGYIQKDIKRIQVQQDFLSEFLKKVTSTDNIIKNLPEIITTAIKYTKTDISITDAIKYSKYISDIDMENVTMETIPGEGGSYYTPDMEAVKEIVDRIFYDIIPESETAQEETGELSEVSDSKNLNIEVANGTMTNGMAGKKRDMLEKEGYTVSGISTYKGQKQEATRIVVKEEGQGNDLVKYFVNANVEVDSELVGDGCDIKIIVGYSED